MNKKVKFSLFSRWAAKNKTEGSGQEGANIQTGADGKVTMTVRRKFRWNKEQRCNFSV